MEQQQPSRRIAPAAAIGMILLAAAIIGAAAYFIFQVDAPAAKPAQLPASASSSQQVPASSPSPLSLAATPSPAASPSPIPTPTPTPSPSPLPLTKPVSSIRLDSGAPFKTFNVSVSKNGIAPSPIVIQKGDSIQLNITAPHEKIDFESPDLKFYIALEAGESTALSLEAEKAGTFVLRCKDFCPAEGRISGALVVQNP
jgi:heme/copper-type cytochrome/quinol oxidase subunit 2